MNFYDSINNFMASAANALWGTPLVLLLLGGGIYFTVISKLTPFRYLYHALDILLGKYDSEDDAFSSLVQCIV
jgi:AGCS family alanine or glycine:cation symporter